MLQIDDDVKLLLAKPFACGAVAAIVDRVWAGQPYAQQNLSFGASVFAGVLAADIAAKHLPQNQNVIEKSLEARALEIGLTSAVAFSVDRFYYRAYPSAYMSSRIGQVIVSEIVGSWVADSFVGSA